MELMIPGDLLHHGAAAEIFKYDEVAQQIEKAPLLENSLDEDLKLRQVIFSERLAGDRAPRLEPLPAGAQRTDPRLDSVRDNQCLVVRKQRLDLGLVSLQLLVGVPNRRVFVGRILEFNHAEWESIHEDDDIRPAVVLVLDNRELIDREPVVVLEIIEIDQPHLRPANRVPASILDRYTIDQRPVKHPVPRILRRPFKPGDFPERLLDRFRRQGGIQAHQRFTQPRRKNDFRIIFSLPLGEGEGVSIAARRYVRPVLDRIAEALQPRQRSFFNNGFGELHRLRMALRLTGF